MYSTTLLIFTLPYVKYTLKESQRHVISPYPRSSHIEIGVQNQAPSEGAQRQIAKGLLWSQFLLAQAESILNFSPAEASHWHLGAAGVTVSKPVLEPLRGIARHLAQDKCDRCALSGGDIHGYSIGTSQTGLGSSSIQLFHMMPSAASWSWPFRIVQLRHWQRKGYLQFHHPGIPHASERESSLHTQPSNGQGGEPVHMMIWSGNIWNYSGTYPHKDTLEKGDMWTSQVPNFPCCQVASSSPDHHWFEQACRAEHSWKSFESSNTYHKALQLKIRLWSCWTMLWGIHSPATKTIQKTTPPANISIPLHCTKVGGPQATAERGQAAGIRPIVAWELGGVALLKHQRPHDIYHESTASQDTIQRNKPNKSQAWVCWGSTAGYHPKPENPVPEQPSLHCPARV